MLTRIYYWIEGAPEDRPGGPWWYQDFVTPEACKSFVESLKPVCHKIMRVDREGLSDMPCHIGPVIADRIYADYQRINVRPPEDAVEI